MIEDVNIISDLKDEADPGVLTYLANQRTRVGLTAICDTVVSFSLTLRAEHTLRGSPVPSQHEQKRYCLVLFNLFFPTYPGSLTLIILPRY